MAEADPVIEPQTAEEVQVEQQEPATPKRRCMRLALMLSIPLLLIAGAGIYWLGLQGKVSTDNAYIQQDKVSVSAEVGGKIIEVLVAEGDEVEAGQLLFRIDPEPYQLQIAQADAAIASAQANVIALQNDSDLTGVDISAAREDIAFAQAKFERIKALWDRGFSTKADYDAAEHAMTQAREQLKQAQARQTEARARLARGSAVPGENPQIAAAKAQKASAELALRRTEVRAPIAGVVAQADRLQPGQQVVSNLPVLTLVSETTTYVEANFKETDLADMQPGQRARIEFDAYPDLELTGHVHSIGAGTGSEFSVLPAQNATGNWVKVTQRVPVRIAVDEQSPRRLIAGLSTEVTVYTNDDAKD
ncbi:membrane fusion protein, multidrug efflux system [Altererythrobacter xiamenensis]|uniref:Membrane fusion protein, multidrug efflux system n=1 Tax=Altererythrobacter xiamenensis TaxID=1316679 RepID=A0A1Y6E4J7_9SPHN|nr:HlyD family secretion protein [Altererythrobacter xiamenensis]SMQ57714.1 membrane fusion protein, multidrug efflux system [Altererythrobacter xiamenensis]